MKFAVIADLHYDAHYSLGQFDALSGLTKRHLDYRKFIEKLAQYCQSTSIDFIICSGDIFDKKGATSSKVLEAFKKDIEKLTIPWYSITGNHDWIDISRNKSLNSVFNSEKFFNYDEPQITFINGICFSLVPDCEDLKEQFLKVIPQNVPENTLKILIAHVGVQGAWLNKLKKSDESISSITVEDLHCDKYDYCFLGDYHTRQKLADNCEYTGSPLQKSFSHEGDPQCISVVTWDGKNLDIEQVSTETIVGEKLPEFETVDISKIKEKSEYGYIKLRSTSPVSYEELDSAKEYLKPISRRIEVDVQVKSSVENSERIDFSKCHTLKDKCMKYIDEKCPENLDPNYLKKIVNLYDL